MARFKPVDDEDRKPSPDSHPRSMKMERMKVEQTYCRNSISCEGLPSTLSTNNTPWLVTQNLDDNGIVNFYTIDERPSNYRCRIPELQHLGGICVERFCHGWMILSKYPHKVMWFLWNPVTSKLIRLPPLAYKDDLDVIRDCCLSSPPGDPSSILLLTRLEKPNFVFCRLVKKRRSKWTEMSYAKQLTRLRGGKESDMLESLTCCNGKVYALLYCTSSVVQIDIKVVKDKQVVITILPFQTYPDPYVHSSPDFCVLKGSGTELFAITGRSEAPAGVYLFKLDMNDDDTTWEEINDLKDAVFFVDLLNIVSVSYIPAVASGLGGYVHVRDEFRMVINSFYVKDKTLLVWRMLCLMEAIQVTLWEYRGLEAGNDRQVKCTNDHKQQEEDKEDDAPIVVPTRSSYTGEDDESRLVDVPFHVLEMIMEHCVGIEYMNFRSTCKRCHLAAPQIHWRNKTALKKLHKYSLVSPWLMVVQDNGGIMNFTDPISGDEYLMKLRLSGVVSLNYDEHNSICCSKYGWLLFYTRSSNLGHHQLVFFNPFTNDVRKLPPTPPHCLVNLCFSAPPTSGTNCMVVGFSIQGDVAYILRYVDQQEERLLWRRFDVAYGGDPDAFFWVSTQAGNLYAFGFHFPTFHGRDLYALCYKGQLVVFKDMSEGSFSQPEVVSAKPPECGASLHSPRYFLMERNQYLLLVIMDKFGRHLKLFEFNDSTKVWNQVESLERHAIFIGDATCVCVEAKTPKMQNKIYFPRLKDGKLIYYSLETTEYHTFDGKLATAVEAGLPLSHWFTTTRHLSLQAWIEPTWY